MSPAPGRSRGVPGQLWLLLRVNARRWRNRIAVAFSRGRGGKPGERGRRPVGRRAPGRWLSAALLIILVPQAFVLSYQLIHRFAQGAQEQAQEQAQAQEQEQAEGEEPVEVHSAVYRVLRADLERLSEDSEEARRAGAERLRSKILQFQTHLGRERDLTPERSTDRIIDAFAERGLSGLAEERSSSSWRMDVDIRRVFEDPASRLRAAGACGLFLFMVWAALLLMGLGGAHQDLGAVGWVLEWLYTLPVSAKTIFLGKALEGAFLGLFAWMVLLPFCSVYFLTTGLGAWGFLIGPVAAVYLLVLLGAARVLIETWLRKRFSLARLKNLQAILGLAGMLLWFLCFAAAYSSGVPRAFAAAAQTPLAALCWSPLAAPALLSAGGAAAWAAGAVMALSAMTLPWGAVRLCERLVRDGLVRSGGAAYAGRRLAQGGAPAPGATAAGAERSSRLPGALRGVIAKDLRLLVRDRSFLVQSLVVPVVILGFQVLVNPALLESARDEPAHAATLAFGVGAYVLAFSGLQALAAEGPALWMLYTFPCGLVRILWRKALLWFGLSSLYTAAIIGWALGHSGEEELLGLGFLALLGIALYALIAVALGALGTDPQETVAQRRVRPLMAQAYLVLAAMFGFALYSDGLWPKIAQVVISASLAGALWQKLRDRIPYLLDPTAAPPPRIGLSDALIVVLFFFVLQGLCTMLGAEAAGGPTGLVLTIAFLVAGALSAAGSLLIFRRRGVPSLLETIGLRAKGASENRSAAVGALGGLAAAAFAWGYLRCIDSFEPLRSLRDATHQLISMRDPGGSVWVGVLAVVLAPLFEEYIFRGLVYGSLRRTIPPWLAALASAALFAVVHPALSALPVFVLGLACALVYERTRLLWGAIATHAVYNAIVFAMQ